MHSHKSAVIVGSPVLDTLLDDEFFKPVYKQSRGRHCKQTLLRTHASQNDKALTEKFASRDSASSIHDPALILLSNLPFLSYHFENLRERHHAAF